VEPAARLPGIRDFYIPDFLRGTGADAASGGTVATIQGQDISAGEFRRIYQAQLQMYRSAYGGQMNDQLLKQLGVETADPAADGRRACRPR